ncbi:uncharacterized protein LOC123522500 [Echinops telfairi]|uniref:Uncharacterized protein LOC123522500 n=1 Tax=Echinops telfairi TaxID=9371 RepID=A0AC55DNF7_ECHTE|nr:uncharacterized protein LOC123522500 [Echinops telfairi]
MTLPGQGWELGLPTPLLPQPVSPQRAGACKELEEPIKVPRTRDPARAQELPYGWGSARTGGLPACGVGSRQHHLVFSPCLNHARPMGNQAQRVATIHRGSRAGSAVPPAPEALGGAGKGVGRGEAGSPVAHPLPSWWRPSPGRCCPLPSGAHQLCSGGPCPPVSASGHLYLTHRILRDTHTWAHMHAWAHSQRVMPETLQLRPPGDPTTPARLSAAAPSLPLQHQTGFWELCRQATCPWSPSSEGLRTEGMGWGQVAKTCVPFSPEMHRAGSLLSEIPPPVAPASVVSLLSSQDRTGEPRGPRAHVSGAAGHSPSP